MTQPYYADETTTIWCGDALAVLRELPDASVDAVITDPPYGLEFMNKQWDSFKAGQPFQAWCQAWAAQCLRVLKPGGHLLAFGGTRTWHRLTSGIEDAGFEIRDSINWMYASGFPKSMDVSKAIDKAAGAVRPVVGVHYRHGGGSPASDSMSGPLGADSELPLTAAATDGARRWEGWGTALKPAHEPICVARRPLAGTVAENVLEYGTGALHIGATRTGSGGHLRWSTPRGMGSENSFADDTWTQAQGRPPAEATASQVGRWPANVVLAHAGDDLVGDLCADRCVPGCPVAALDAQTGVLRSGSLSPHHNIKASTNTSLSGPNQADRVKTAFGGDQGGASRFYPVFRYEAKAGQRERPRVNGVAHPTVKPVALMTWLVRLVTAPGATVLDPFAGSGTTGQACLVEGRRVILVEREPDYLPLIVARIGGSVQPPLAVYEAGGGS